MGSGREYFGIWIVNLLLSILTLGVYSAWAKVRTNRYFYGHLQVGGHGLRYLANPVQILIGRVIGVALFGGVIAIVNANPLAILPLGLLLVFISPYLACLSLRFNLRMTAWRNVRFAFNGEYGGAFAAFVFYPWLASMTMLLAAPWALRRVDTFIYQNVSYGDRPVTCDISVGR